MKLARIAALPWAVFGLAALARGNLGASGRPDDGTDRYPGAAASYVVAVDGSIVWGRSLDAPRPPASLAKIMTFFFVWLVPTNSVLPRLDVANDRQVYMALIGSAWLLGWTLSRAMAERRWLVAAVLAGCVVPGAATFLRNRVYASEVVFWQDAVSKAPHNARAFNKSIS